MVLNFMKQANRKVALLKIKQSIEHVRSQGRLAFKDGGMIEYADKDGVVKDYTVDELATHLWFAMDTQLVRAASASLAVLEIGPEHVKEIIMKIPRKTTEAKK